MPKLIHSNQSGYVEGRFIGETIRTIDDIMEFTKCEGIGGILAFLDFEKAFDSVEWNFLHKCLDIFNFGSDFKKWVSVLYTDISSCVSNNGVHSGFFALERRSGEHAPFTRASIIGQTRQWVNNTNNAPSLNNKRGAD